MPCFIWKYFLHSEDCLFILFAKKLGVEFDLEEYCD